MTRGPETRRTRAGRRLLGLAGALAALVAAVVLSAPAAFTAGTPTGHEQIIRPVHVQVGVLVGNIPVTAPAGSPPTTSAPTPPAGSLTTSSRSPVNPTTSVSIVHPNGGSFDAVGVGAAELFESAGGRGGWAGRGGPGRRRW